MKKNILNTFLNTLIFSILLVAVSNKWYGNSNFLKLFMLIIIISMVLKYSETVFIKLLVNISKLNFLKLK